MRYLMIVQYNGQNFNGFQKQKSGNTIQNHIENALKTILKQEINSTGSGRTDAGVSAYFQPVHFETDVEIEPHKFIRSMNGILPDEIKVLSIEKTIVNLKNGVIETKMNGNREKVAIVINS